jgi:galactokinase
MTKHDVPTRGLFENTFGHSAECRSSAPARVNLIGEHVDYCDGLVLPIAIDLRVTLDARIGGNRCVRIASPPLPDCRIELTGNAIERGEPRWSNYLRGVMAGFQQRGVTVPGMDILVTSTVPPGAGLSSSAALEVATATLLEAVTGLELSGDEKALLCQTAEQRYALVPCGIMDQFASIFGRAGAALLLDCRSRQTRYIPLPPGDVAVLLFDTHVKHDLSTGEYAERRRQTEEAAKQLGVASLRDLVDADWRARLAKLPPLLAKRARHVVSEIERVAAFASLAEKRNWRGAGLLMQASHNSLRDDFEVSCAELDFICDIAAAMPGVYGFRMTGGGFGGCCVALAEPQRADGVGRELVAAFRERFQREPSYLVTQAAGGPRVKRL